MPIVRWCQWLLVVRVRCGRGSGDRGGQWENHPHLPDPGSTCIGSRARCGAKYRHPLGRISAGLRVLRWRLLG